MAALGQSTAILYLIIRSKNEVAKGLSSIGNSITLAAAAGSAIMAGAVAESLKNAATLETMRNNLITQAGASVKQVDAWQKQLSRNADNLPFTDAEGLQSLYYIKSAGLSGKAAMDAYTQSAKEAAASQTDVLSTVQATLTLMNGLSKEGAHVNFNQLMSLKLGAVVKGRMKVADVNAIAMRSATTAGSIGIDPKSFFTMMAAGSQMGIKPARLGTAMDTFFREFSKMTAGELKAARDNGVTNFSAAGLRSEGIQKFISRVYTQVQKASGGNQDEMARVMNQLFANTNAAKLAITFAQHPTYMKSTRSFMDKAAGKDLTKQAFGASSKSMAGQLGAIKGNLFDVSADFGSLLGPATKQIEASLNTGLVPALRQLVTWMGSARQVTQHLATTFTMAKAFMSGFGIVASATWGVVSQGVRLFSQLASVFHSGGSSAAQTARNLKGLGTIVGLVVVGLGAMKVAMLANAAAAVVIGIATKAWTAAQLALNIVMSANLIGIVVIAIAGLVAGVIYAYTHFKFFHDFVNNTWSALSTKLLPILKTVGTFLVNDIGPVIGTVARVYLGFLLTQLKVAWAAVKTLWGWLKFFLSIMQSLKGPVGSIAGAIKDKLGGAFGFVSGIVNGLIGTVGKLLGMLPGMSKSAKDWIHSWGTTTTTVPASPRMMKMLTGLNGSDPEHQKTTATQATKHSTLLKQIHDDLVTYQGKTYKVTQDLLNKMGWQGGMASWMKSTVNKGQYLADYVKAADLKKAQVGNTSGDYVAARNKLDADMILFRNGQVAQSQILSDIKAVQNAAHAQNKTFNAQRATNQAQMTALHQRQHLEAQKARQDHIKQLALVGDHLKMIQGTYATDVKEKHYKAAQTLLPALKKAMEASAVAHAPKGTEALAKQAADAQYRKTVASLDATMQKANQLHNRTATARNMGAFNKAIYGQTLRVLPGQGENYGQTTATFGIQSKNETQRVIDALERQLNAANQTIARQDKQIALLTETRDATRGVEKAIRHGSMPGNGVHGGAGASRARGSSGIARMS